MKANAIDVRLHSPSTALAGLSLQTSGFDARPQSASQLTLDSTTPASPVVIVSPSTPTHMLPSTESLVPAPPSPIIIKTNSPKTPPRLPAPSVNSEPPSPSHRPSVPTQSKPPHVVLPPVTPLLPSSAVNANPLVPSTHHTLDVLSSAEAPPSLAVPVEHAPEDALPSHGFIAAAPPPAVPKKSPVKRRTLADWKSRKEKERIAQALVQPAPPLRPSTPSLESGRGVTILMTGSIHPTDIQMDANDRNTDAGQTASSSHSECQSIPQGDFSPHLVQSGDLERKREMSELWNKEVESSPERSTKLPIPQPPSLSASSPLSSSRVLAHSLDTVSYPRSPSFRQPIERLPHNTQSLVQSSPPRPTAEDGEIGSSVTDVVPRFPSSLPSPCPSSRPPSRPRSPPTQPRSFRVPSPTPSLTRSSPPSRARGGSFARHGSDHRANPRARPLPNAPRALRNGFQPPVSSGSSASYYSRGHGRPSSSGRGGLHSSSDAIERESDRGWATRGHGRRGDVNGGNGGIGDRR